MSLPFIYFRPVKSLPQALKKYPFRAELLHIGHHSGYPPGYPAPLMIYPNLSDGDHFVLLYHFWNECIFLKAAITHGI